MDSLRIKYADRKLSVVDVSIDVNENRWKEAIKKDTLDWLSCIDTKGWESSIVKKCIITDIPCFVICSEAKRVLFQTTSFADLDKELNSILPQPEKKQNKKKKKK